MSHIIEADDMRKSYENWLRVVILIDCAGKCLLSEVLHTKEKIPTDGEQLYWKLESYQNKMYYQINEEILCPSNKFIDVNKFDILLYTTVIYYMFGNKYEKLLDDVGDMRSDIFHMKDDSIIKADFDKLWKCACNMFRNHGFDIKSFQVFKTCNLFSVEQYRGIMEFFSLS